MALNNPEHPLHRSLDAVVASDKIALGIEDESFEVDHAGFRDLVTDARTALDGLLAALALP